MTDVRELAGMLLLVIGAMAVGHLMYPIITGGMKVLTPFEATVFADSAAALAIGVWLLFTKRKP